MIIVDASAMVELLSRTPKAARLEHLLDDELFAPDLLVAEVLHYFRRTVANGGVNAADATAAVGVFEAADIEYLPVWPYTNRIWELRHNLSPYDACYIAMAEDIGCPLVTTEARLGHTPGLRASVVVA
jgi:predicted nucleic acid-binding protein